MPGSTQMTAGCETNINSEVNRCSSCTNDCDALYKMKPNVVTMRCGNGMCKVDTCAPHFLDCDGAPSNGCEQAFDAAHCGRCAPACAAGTTCDLVSWTCK